jgi:hypothetical protein
MGEFGETAPIWRAIVTQASLIRHSDPLGSRAPDIEDFALQGQDRLKAPAAALLGRAAGA